MRRRELGAQRAVVALALASACSIDDRDVRGPPFEIEPFGLGGTQNQAAGQGGTPGIAPAGFTAGAEGQLTNQQPGAGGAGQPTGSEGQGGAPPAAGGSTPGAGGSGDGAECVAGQPGCIGVGVVLSARDGRVALESNGLGVQGSFFVGSDGMEGGPSTISAYFVGADICVSGTAGPVGLGPGGTPDYSRSWGAVLGLNLWQPEGTETAGDWSPTTPSGEVTGFSFVMSGSVIPADVRFAVDGRESYCGLVSTVSGMNQTWPLGELETECWSGMGVSPRGNEPFTTLQWLIPTNTDFAVPFEFCITDLRAIVD
jgi:hypothetical protein